MLLFVTWGNYTRAIGNRHIVAGRVDGVSSRAGCARLHLPTHQHPLVGIGDDVGVRNARGGAGATRVKQSGVLSQFDRGSASIRSYAQQTKIHFSNSIIGQL
jgi:hypothetical protein